MHCSLKYRQFSSYVIDIGSILQTGLGDYDADHRVRDGEVHTVWHDVVQDLTIGSVLKWNDWRKTALSPKKYYVFWPPLPLLKYFTGSKQVFKVRSGGSLL